jgi:alkylation response protein AidB-like acyl-CoA dehydrogenase
MGWLGAAIPEEHGGLGLGRLELCVLAEEIGRAVAPIPFSSTVYFFAEALMLAGSDAQKAARCCRRLRAARPIGCFALSEGPGAPTACEHQAKFDGSTLTGVKIPVTDGDCATHAVVVAKDGGGVSLVLVDLNQPGVTRTTLKTLDPTRGHAKLEFKGAKAERSAPLGKVGSWRSKCSIAPRC